MGLQGGPSVDVLVTKGGGNRQELVQFDNQLCSKKPEGGQSFGKSLNSKKQTRLKVFQDVESLATIKEGGREGKCSIVWVVNGFGKQQRVY